MLIIILTLELFFFSFLSTPNFYNFEPKSNSFKKLQKTKIDTKIYSGCCIVTTKGLVTVCFPSDHIIDPLFVMEDPADSFMAST